MEDRSLDMALEKMFMGSIQAQYKFLTHDNTPPWYETLEVNSTQLRFKLDSGADVSIISKTEYDRMKVKPPVNANANEVDWCCCKY